MSKHRLGSVGGVQTAIKKLLEIDYIEQSEGSRAYVVVDPVFAIWLKDSPF
jgi:hypothetical protein